MHVSFFIGLVLVRNDEVIVCLNSHKYTEQAVLEKIQEKKTIPKDNNNKSKGNPERTPPLQILLFSITLFYWLNLLKDLNTRFAKCVEMHYPDLQASLCLIKTVNSCTRSMLTVHSLRSI